MLHQPWRSRSMAAHTRIQGRTNHRRHLAGGCRGTLQQVASQLRRVCLRAQASFLGAVGGRFLTSLSLLCAFRSRRVLASLVLVIFSQCGSWLLT